MHICICYIILHEYMYVLCQLLQCVAALIFEKVVQYDVNVRVTADAGWFGFVWLGVLVFFHELMSAIFCCSLKNVWETRWKGKDWCCGFWNYSLLSSLLFSHQTTFISSLIIFNSAHSLLYKKKGARFHSEFAFPRTWNMRASFAFVTSILETFSVLPNSDFIRKNNNKKCAWILC